MSALSPQPPGRFSAAIAAENAILVGTALWLADDMAAMYRSLRVERKSLSCGRCKNLRPHARGRCAHVRPPWPDIIGFVVEYPHPVPWNLDVATAQRLLVAVDAPAKTCIVTGGPPEKICRLALMAKPDYLQLHCRETLADTAYLAQTLARQGVKIIKTLFPDTPDLERTATAFCAAGVATLLFDPRTPDNAVHGGEADLAVFAGLQRTVSCPVILAGGITPANVAAIVRQAQPRIIDLMTGVELRPGVKDEAKVIALFQALQETCGYAPSPATSR